MNFERFIGVLCGIAFGVALVFLLFKALNKDGHMKTQYDERQEIIRGKGYACGYWTVSAVLFILILLDVADIKLPAEPSAIYFFVFFCGGIALSVHSILNGAYFGLNNEKKKWIPCLIIFGVINFSVSAVSIAKGELFVDGHFGIQIVNLLCGLLLLIILVTLGIKKLMDNREMTADEES